MTCKLCKFDPKSRSAATPLKDGLCWNCRFWQPFIQQRYEIYSARHRSRLYVVHGDLEARKSCYPPETRWLFEFYDGRLVVTRNVTCHGAIPERFWRDLPNNVRTLTTNSNRAKLWEAYQRDLPDVGYGNPEINDELPEPRVAPPTQLPQVQGNLFD